MMSEDETQIGQVGAEATEIRDPLTHAAMAADAEAWSDEPTTAQRCKLRTVCGPVRAVAGSTGT